MRVVCDEQPAADMVQVWVFEDAFHQPFAQALTAKILVDEDIAKIADNGKISNNPRHTYLTLACIQAKGKRVGKRLICTLARTRARPIGTSQKIVHNSHLEAEWVGADGELVVMDFEHLGHAASVSQHGIIPEIHIIARTVFSLKQSLHNRGWLRAKGALAMTYKLMENYVQTYSMEYFCP